MKTLQFSKHDLLTDVNLCSLKENFINKHDESALDILVSYFFDLGRLYNQNMGDSQLKILIKDIMTSYLSIQDRKHDFFKYVINKLTYNASNLELEYNIKNTKLGVNQSNCDLLLKDSKLLNYCTFHYMFYIFKCIDQYENYDETFANYYLLIRSYIVYYINQNRKVRWLSNSIEHLCKNYEKIFIKDCDLYIVRNSVVDLLYRAANGEIDAKNEIFIKKSDLINSKLNEMVDSLRKFYKQNYIGKMIETNDYSFLDEHFTYPSFNIDFQVLKSDIYLGIIKLIDDVLVKYKGRYQDCNFSRRLDWLMQLEERKMKNNIINIINGKRPSLVDEDVMNWEYLNTVSLEQSANESLLQYQFDPSEILPYQFSDDINEKYFLILYQISIGMKQADVAKKLGVSRQYIYSVLKNIKDKLNDSYIQGETYESRGIVVKKLVQELNLYFKKD